MITKENLQKIGSLAKPHGVNGEVVVRLLPELEGFEPQPEFVFIDLLGGLVPFEVISVRTKGKNDLLMILDTLSTEEKARKLQGAEVYINQNELGEQPVNNDLSIHALTGYEVYDSEKGHLGKINAIIEINNNPLMEIIYKSKELLIPINEDFFKSVDNQKRVIELETPPGLIDLYLE
jgi:16S rRNA processing protein RimM